MPVARSTEDGLAVLRDFTANFTTKVPRKAPPDDSAKDIGPVAVGNGELSFLKDATTMIQDAVNAQSLTPDLTLIETKFSKCEVATTLHKHGAGVHYIRWDALAGRPEVRAERRPNHSG